MSYAADKKDRVEVRTIHGTKGDSFRLAAGIRMEMVPPDRRRLSTYELRTEIEEAREASCSRRLIRSASSVVVPGLLPPSMSG